MTVFKCMSYLVDIIYKIHCLYYNILFDTIARLPVHTDYCTHRENCWFLIAGLSVLYISAGDDLCVSVSVRLTLLLSVAVVLSHSVPL